RHRIGAAAPAPPGVSPRRVAAEPRPSNLSIRITSQPFASQANLIASDTSEPGPAAPEAWTLVPHTVDTGLGEHKWADRRRLEPVPEPGRELLLLDADGSVLEGARSNVFLVDRHGLHTPDLDGRILPGCMRAHVIELARRADVPVSERRVTVEDLARAEEVFLTNALRGVFGVTAGDGIGRWRVGPVTRWLCSAVSREDAPGPPTVLEPTARALLLHRQDPFAW